MIGRGGRFVMCWLVGWRGMDMDMDMDGWMNEGCR